MVGRARRFVGMASGSYRPDGRPASVMQDSLGACADVRAQACHVLPDGQPRRIRRSSVNGARILTPWRMPRRRQYSRAADILKPTRIQLAAAAVTFSTWT